MADKAEIAALSPDLFKQNGDASALHDQAFETKPISFFRDSMRRFAKNKGSVVAAVIILIIILYAIIVPIASPKNYVDPVTYPNGFYDNNFAYALPYCSWFKGTGFWDGTKVVSMGENAYNIAKLNDSNHEYVVRLEGVTERRIGANITRSYSVRVDTYGVRCKTVNVSSTEYASLVQYENEQGIAGVEGKSIMKPLVDYHDYLGDTTDSENYHAEGSYWYEMKWDLVNNYGYTETSAENTANDRISRMASYYNQNQNVYYKLTAKSASGTYSDTTFYPVYESDGETPVDIYMKDDSGNYVYSSYSNGEYSIRVDYFDYFTFHNGFEPYYIFGANASGQDIFLRLAKGARFSLLLGVGVSLINFIIGLIWGAISGYYGGVTDLIMERVTDIISAIPSLVILTVCSIQFTNNAGLRSAIGNGGVIVLAFLVAFVYSGWIGTASTTRMQFYRFKGQEYVLASRTLGARDSRLIFRHILPNAAGTLVTSSVLMIPSVIFSESSLTYLGIVDFSTSGICSIGALLNEGQTAGLNLYPHVLLFPCIVISLLMISFNLFGNGLRDAFNTQLKGTD
jgi:oligopeptide transport system permease protein